MACDVPTCWWGAGSPTCRADRPPHGGTGEHPDLVPVSTGRALAGIVLERLL